MYNKNIITITMLLYTIVSTTAFGMEPIKPLHPATLYVASTTLFDANRISPYAKPHVTENLPPHVFCAKKIQQHNLQPSINNNHPGYFLTQELIPANRGLKPMEYFLQHVKLATKLTEMRIELQKEQREYEVEQVKKSLSVFTKIDTNIETKKTSNKRKRSSKKNNRPRKKRRTE